MPFRYTLEEWNALPEDDRPGDFQPYTPFGADEPTEYRHPELLDFSHADEVHALKRALQQERENARTGNRTERELQDQLRDLQTQLDELRSEPERLRDELTAAKRETRIQQAIAEFGADPVLASFLRERARDTENGIAIFDSDGTLLRDQHGDAISLSGYIAQLREDPQFAHYFRATARSGTGARRPADPGTAPLRRSAMSPDARAKFIAERGSQAYFALPA